MHLTLIDGAWDGILLDGLSEGRGGNCASGATHASDVVCMFKYLYNALEIGF